MGLLSAIGKLISKIFRAIFKWLKKILGEFWLIILILVVIWFAPVIAPWLASVGAPAWAVSFMASIATNLTPLLVSAGQWLWSAGGSVLSGAWQAYNGLGTGMQAAVAVGAAAMIAPEETQSVVEEVGTVIGAGTEAIVGGVGTAILSNPTTLVLAGVLAWWLFFRNDDDGEPRRELPQSEGE